MRISDWSSDVCSSDLLPRRSARAIGDGDEAGLQRLKRLDRLPERFLHRRRLWREELERDRHIAGKIGVQRRCHATLLSFGASAPRSPTHRVTVNSPPLNFSATRASSPAAARKSTRLNSSNQTAPRMPYSA